MSRAHLRVPARVLTLSLRIPTLDASSNPEHQPSDLACWFLSHRTILWQYFPGPVMDLRVLTKGDSDLEFECNTGHTIF